ncbi:serine hydrolase domain-containing protein [Hymenobacter guriensis]|uniref:Beta-lactamase family protein n=1 Tax=Hymenobacter guriensis TaxID=2793065 RepID=A0ABS0L209_9BACT|nr:serine hydrolase domain-containing protein [Hymenobacter guriensis]MBG8554146.1 beta-lactamase family protein [Hymenobacter guriensis]
MKHPLLLLSLLLPFTTAQAQRSLYFPPVSGTATWATASPQSLGWCQPQLDSLLNFLERKNTKSFLILKDGRLVVEKYYGSYTQDSIWYWASAGKALTATLVGLAQQEKQLMLTDSVSKHLGRGWTSATSAQERQITVRHLLAMTSGLDDTPPLPCDNESTDKACLLYHAPAGSRWSYHTGAYRRLLDVLAKSSGLPINQYTNQKLAERIGMRGAWVQGVYYSRARDMARFGLLALAKGQWNGSALLTDADYFRQMTTPSQAYNQAYGYLWWLNGQSSYMLPGPQQTVLPGPLIPSAPDDLFAALGKNDQKIYVVPSQGLVVLRQGKSAGGPRLAVSSFDTELWSYISALSCAVTATTNKSGARRFWYLSPNPATGAARISWTGSPPPGSELRLLDNLSRERGRVAGSAPVLPLSGLAPGLYLVQGFAADGRSLGVQRLVVQ